MTDSAATTTAAPLSRLAASKWCVSLSSDATGGAAPAHMSPFSFHAQQPLCAPPPLPSLKAGLSGLGAWQVEDGARWEVSTAAPAAASSLDEELMVRSRKRGWDAVRPWKRLGLAGGWLGSLGQAARLPCLPPKPGQCAPLGQDRSAPWPPSMTPCHGTLTPPTNPPPGVPGGPDRRPSVAPGLWNGSLPPP